MLKWLADLFGVGHKPEPVREETVRVAAPAALQAPVTDVAAKVEKKPAAKPAAKAATKAKPAAKATKATTKKTK
jgi:hypothetical protein